MAQFPSQSSASGLWTLKKQKRAAQGLNWPPLFGPADEYFENVTLLLPGNGTNGAQNNTFLDSSTNNFTITRNGNTTQGTFAPFGSNWSNFFDGSGDWLSVSSQTALGMGAGDFTYEAWIFVNETVPTNALRGLFDSRVGGATGCGIYTSADSGTTAKLVYATNSAIAASSSSQIPSFTWAHIAVTRSGTTVRGFINGNLEFTVTDSRTFSSSAGTDIGRDITPAYFNGYISNARILKGTALYTAAFTPPTSPLTAITNTSLLTCQSNRFIDNSTNAFTITRNGDVSVQRFSPFNPTAPYAASTDGGSGYFDGSGDYLTAPDAAALDFGTGDFTVEGWFYFNSLSNVPMLWHKLASNSGWFAEVGASVIYYGYANAVSSQYWTLSTTLVTGTWYHLAFTRVGSTLSIYINGTKNSTTLAGANSSYDNSASFVVGSFQPNSSSLDLNGYVSNFRVVKGTEVYTANFTPPAAPVTAITNTSLLLNYTNAGILDNAEMNNLETVGNAQISTAQSKFGGGSIAFDGTGDALALPANVNLAVGSGDFTLEMWVYGANNGSIVGGSYPRLFALGTAQTLGCFECYNAAGTMYIEMNNGSAITFTASTLLNSTWNHFAIARSGSSVKAFVNGTQVGAVTNSVNLNLAATTQSWIGAISASAGNFNGYIDDLRITKGYARYTANFTPPTAPFPLY